MAQGPHAIHLPRAQAVTAAVAGPGASMWRDTFDFIAAGPAFSGEIVKDSPYSADAVTETQQTLADGNRINRTNTSRIYRDSQGRTRREQQINSLGPWASAGEPTEMVFIDDPVAGVNYVINTNAQTAQKTEVHMERIEHKIEEGESAEKVVTWKADRTAAGQPGQMILRTERHEVKQGEQGEHQEHRNVTFMPSVVAPDMYFTPDEAKTESLGKQMIEGVEAEGVRTTTIIPAGQIGNERPIEMVSETWFSPQLKAVVLTKNNDPRMGETTYRLTNIQLIEPLPSMFEVPAGYNINEGAVNVFRRKLSPGGGETGPGH
jgi:hypothetical protein